MTCILILDFNMGVDDSISFHDELRSNKNHQSPQSETQTRNEAKLLTSNIIYHTQINPNFSGHGPDHENIAIILGHCQIDKFEIVSKIR